MVLRASEPEGKKAMMEAEDKKRSHDESLQRTQKGFQILSERGETMSTWSDTSMQHSFNIVQPPCVHLHYMSHVESAAILIVMW